MERKSRISIYDTLKKANKTNSYEKNHQPYFEIQEFSHAKAITYSVKETADNMLEIAKVYEVEAFERDLLKLLDATLGMDDFYQKYIIWNDAIAMLAKPIYERIKRLVKNNRVNRKNLYYLGVDLTTKSEDVVFAAIGVLILSQFQNDISEEIIQTLSKHSRLIYYCLISVSEFENSIAITNKMISNLPPTPAMIAALSLDYSVESNVKWLFDYAILNARDLSALSFKVLTDPYIKKALSTMEIDAKHFSKLTRIAIYGIDKENMLSYSAYHTNFISEFLLKLLVNLDVDLCETLSDQCFLILAMHIFTSLKDQFSEIEEDILKCKTQQEHEFTHEQLQEVRRNILKEKIMVNALLHTDYIENLYHYKIPPDIKDLGEDEIQEFINQLNEWMEEEYAPVPQNSIIQERELFEEALDPFEEDLKEDDRMSIRRSPYFNEEIESISNFMRSIFKHHKQLTQIENLVKHSGDFKEDYKELTDEKIDKYLIEIDEMFRSEVFLDNLLDEIQFSQNRPMLSLPILTLFNIIPEFPYFHKMLEDYPLSQDLLNFCTWQFEYYHRDIAQYFNSYVKKKQTFSEHDFLFTDAYVLKEAFQVKQWALTILEKYIEFQKAGQKEVEASPDFLCNILRYAEDADSNSLLELFKNSREKMTSKHFEAIYEFIKHSPHAQLRRKFSSFLGLTQTLIKNSVNYQDALLKHRQNQHGSIIKLPGKKKS